MQPLILKSMCMARQAHEKLKHKPMVYFDIGIGQPIHGIAGKRLPVRLYGAGCKCWWPIRMMLGCVCVCCAHKAKVVSRAGCFESLHPKIHPKIHYVSIHPRIKHTRFALNLQDCIQTCYFENKNRILKIKIIQNCDFSNTKCMDCINMYVLQ